jgi:pimeloyl-ACP methyl ester carboxylesterase
MAHKPPAGDRPAPRLRRAYFDCRYGQLHLHNAIPAGGGFDELTTLVCLHGQGQTGRVFAPLLADLGRQRSVYAPDLPGQGESDPAPGVESITAATHAIGDFVDSMRIRHYDLLARGEGCAVARRLVIERPQAVRRLVLLDDPTPQATAPQASTAQPVLSVPAGGEGAAGLVERIEAFLAG